jgi:hypothetical protein
MATNKKVDNPENKYFSEYATNPDHPIEIKCKSKLIHPQYLLF